MQAGRGDADVAFVKQWQQGLADQWNAELTQAAVRQRNGRGGAAGRAYRRKVGLVVWLVGDLCTLTAVLAWWSGGRVPRLLIGLAVVLWGVGVAMMLTGHNPLERFGRPAVLPGALAYGASPDRPSPSVPALTGTRSARYRWERPLCECPNCGARAAWDGSVETDEAGPALGFRCVCGNRFATVDPPGLDALRAALVAAPIRWRAEKVRAERRWSSDWDGLQLDLELGDFPAEPLYLLFIHGVRVAGIDDWPEAWPKGDHAAHRVP
ncbi:MAG: hypothetical protein IT196_15730 [Acidimicrobiales bacterium]|nr:hypothetical protein [Acidimicrobiales bacterium]